MTNIKIHGIYFPLSKTENQYLIETGKKFGVTREYFLHFIIKKLMIHKEQKWKDI